MYIRGLSWSYNDPCRLVYGTAMCIVMVFVVGSLDSVPRQIIAKLIRIIFEICKSLAENLK